MGRGDGTDAVTPLVSDAASAAIIKGIGSKAGELVLFEMRGVRVAPGRARKIINSLQGCPFLVQIVLPGCMLGDNAITPLVKLLASPGCKLEFLDLAKNNLSHIGTKKLAAALRDNPTVSTLYLNNNRPGMQGTVGLARALKMNVTLRSLFLLQCGVRDPGVDCLLEALQTNSTLTELALEYNFEVSEHSARRVQEAMQARRSQCVVVAAPTASIDYLVRGEGDPTLAAEAASRLLGSLGSVRSLNVAGNCFGDTLSTRVLSLLPRCTALTELDVSANALGEAGGLWLAHAIELHPMLRSLDASHNRFTAFAASELGQALRNNTSLTCLDLHGNVLIGDDGAKNLVDGIMFAEGAGDSRSGLMSLDLGACGLTTKAEKIFLGLMKSGLPIVHLGLEGNEEVGIVARAKLSQAIAENRQAIVAFDEKSKHQILEISQKILGTTQFEGIETQVATLLRDLGSMSPRWASLRMGAGRRGGGSDDAKAGVELAQSVTDFSGVRRTYLWSLNERNGRSYFSEAPVGTDPGPDATHTSFTVLLVSYLIAAPRQLQLLALALGERPDTDLAKDAKNAKIKRGPGPHLIAMVDAYAAIVKNAESLDEISENDILAAIVDTERPVRAAGTAVDNTSKSATAPASRFDNVASIHVEAVYDRIEQTALLLRRTEEYLCAFSLLVQGDGGGRMGQGLPFSAMSAIKSATSFCLESLGQILREILLSNVFMCVEVAETAPPELIGTIAVIDREDRLERQDRLLPAPAEKDPEKDSATLDLNPLPSGAAVDAETKEQGEPAESEGDAAYVTRFKRLVDKMKMGSGGDAHLSFITSTLQSNASDYHIDSDSLRSEVYSKLELFVFYQFQEAFQAIQTQLRVNLGVAMVPDHPAAAGAGVHVEATPGNEGGRDAQQDGKAEPDLAKTPEKIKNDTKNAENGNLESDPGALAAAVAAAVSAAVAARENKKSASGQSRLAVDRETAQALQDRVAETQTPQKALNLEAFLEGGEAAAADEKATAVRVKGKARLEIILAVLQKLVEDLLVVCEVVVPCFPPDYHIFRFFLSRYNAFANHTLAQNVRDDASGGAVVPRTILLKGIKWIQWYIREIAELARDNAHYVGGLAEMQATTEPLVRSWDQVTERLQMDWLAQMRERLSHVMSKIQTKGLTDTPIKLRREGRTLIGSHKPQDLFSALNSYLDPPLRPPAIHGAVVLNITLVVLGALDAFQEDLVSLLSTARVDGDQSIHIGVGRNRQKCSDEQLISFLNDCVQYQAYANRLFRSRLIPAVAADATEATLKAINRRVDACCKRFGSLYKRVPSILIATVLCALFVPIDELANTTLNPSLWKGSSRDVEDVGDGSAVADAGRARKVALATLTATLNDFFSDWAPDIHPTRFALLFRQALRAVACEYVRAFARRGAARGIIRKQLDDAARLAELVQFDTDQLKIYIQRFDKAFPEVKFPKNIAEIDLLPMNLLNRILTAQSVDELKDSRGLFQRTITLLRATDEAIRSIDITIESKMSGSRNGDSIKDVRRRADALRAAAAQLESSSMMGAALGDTEPDADGNGSPGRVTEAELNVLSGLLKCRREFKAPARKRFLAGFTLV